MASFDEFRNKMNSKYGEKKKREVEEDKISSSKPNTDGSRFSSLRDEMESRYNPVKNVDREYITSFLEDSESYFDTAQDESERKKTVNDLHDRSFAISQYLKKNKDYIDEDSFNALSNYLDEFGKASTQASMYTHYYDPVEGRQKAYESNKSRIEEIDSILSAGTAENAKGLKAEKKKLEDENRLYERTQGKADSYAYIYSEDDFNEASKNRNTNIPTREQLGNKDIRMDAGSWYTDANGKMYNALGEEVAENDIYGIDSSGNYYLKEDKGVDRLGLYLSTSEDERTEALGNPGAEGDWESIIGDGIHGNWEQLTEQEVSAYYYLLNTKGYDAADKYLEDMTPELNRRATEEYNQNLAEIFEDANPLEKAAYNIATLGTTLFGNIAAGTEDALNILTGQDINPYSAAHGAANFSSQVRGLTAEEINEMTGGAALPLLDFSLGDAYQAGMSYLDSVVGALTGSKIYGLSMGLGAFSDTATDLYQKGASTGEIASVGTIAGIAEGFFEKYSLDKVIKTGDSKTLGQFLKNVAKQAGIEASEEAATTITNIVADAIIRKGSSNWDELLNESDGNVLVALGKEIQQVGKDALSGAISGAMGGGVVTTMNNLANQIDTYKQGKSILESKGYNDLKALAQSVSEEAAGLKAGKDVSKAVKKAETKTNAKNVGRLSSAVETAREGLNKTDIQNSLEEKGMSKRQARQTTEKIIEVAEKKAVGQEISEADYKAITKDKATYEAYRSLISDPDSPIHTRNNRYTLARQGIIEAEDGSVSLSDDAERRVADKIMHKTALERISSQNRFEANTGVISETDEADDYTAPMTAEEAAQYKGKATYTDPETGETKAIKIQGISSIKDGEMTLKLEGGETVNANDVRFASEGEALVYSAVLNMGVNAGVAEALVNNFKTAGYSPDSAGRYVLGIKDAYFYGKMNIPLSQLSKNSFAFELSKDQREYVYKLGQSEATSEAKAKQKAIDSKVAQAKKSGKVKAKSGNIIYEEGVSANEKTGEIDESSLTDIQKANLAGIKALAELSPINFHIFRSEKVNGSFVASINGTPTSANGVYFSGTNDIWIDLNAGDMGEGTMLWTAGHEVSHYIRERSPAKWKAMADFLIKEYAKQQDVSVSEMLDNQKSKIMRRADAGTKSESAIIDEAYEELVSDALSDMLTDGSIVNTLAKIKQKDKSLWQAIKDAVSKLLERWGEILGVYKGRDNDTAEARALAGMEDTFKKLQKMYSEAFIEANAVEEAEAYLKENGFDVITDEKQEAASLNSVRNLLSNDQQQKVAEALAARFDVTTEEAIEWLTAETSLASLILNPKYSQYLDYEGDPSEEAIKKNSDYPQGTVDFSNICKKRRAFTEVMDRVLRNFPTHVFMATDLAKIRTIMEQEGMEVACAICYVEDRRQLDSIVAKDFIDSLELYRKGSKTRPDGKPFNANQLKAMSLIEGDTYTPSVYELISLEGRNELKAKNPNMEAAWVRFNNARGMQSVRLLSNEAEYTRQILKYNKKTVQSKNDHGGLRIYSFSDMEMFHLIDIIQVITDSSAVGLMLQGYTKVNEYAKAVKDTGEKLNRSLIPKGDLGYHIENGKVVLDFDTVEGIDINHPDFFDSTDNPNIGNIVIGINKKQIQAAMVSKFIDQIIPFHTGQSSEVLGEKGIATWQNYKDSQTEKDLATGTTAKHQINIYTEVIQAAEKEGKPITNKVEFVNNFLAVCKENGLEPRFSEFLNTDENGDYVYTEGYHKFLVDFKTFDQNTGEYLPQKPVKPVFDNGYITQLLRDYAKTQKVKDAKLAKSMPKVIERITNEVVKADKPKAKYSERYNSAEENHDILTMASKVESGKFEANERVVLGTVSPTISKQIHNLTGINVNGYKVAIEARQINHILKDHGKQGLTDRSMANPSDIAKMEYALNDPDDIRKAGKTQAYTHMVNGRNRTADTVLYEKNIGTKSYYVVQAVPDTKAKTLYIVTAFIGKKGYKKEAPQLINATSLDVTAKTGSADASTNSISQSSDSVKRKLSERSKAPTFYSYMGKVVDGIKSAKVGAGGVVSYLKGKGVKNEEIKWSGIEAFLEGKKSVSKQELQEFVAGSMLQIGEQMSGKASLAGEDGNTYTDIEFKDKARAIAKEKGKDPDRVKFIETDDGEYIAYISHPIDGQIFSAEIEEIGGSLGRWGEYKLDGGENYRELVFTMPNSSYTNRAMQAHWGEDAAGVLAHARIQDFNTSEGRMLFIEEIQSDWHNAGHNEGYVDKPKMVSIENTSVKFEGGHYRLYRGNQELYAHISETLLKNRFPRGITDAEIHQGLVDIHNNQLKSTGAVNDAPFRSNYHEFVLKRLIRMAAEEGYDSIGWTPADIQSERWSDRYAEGYRIEYDQDIPKFLNKYGKKWGAKVGKTTIDVGVASDFDREMEAKGFLETDPVYTEVWSMPITDSMKQSVLYEGQALYSERNKVSEIKASQYQDMVNHFGMTRNFDVAGYMLGNGAMLDFSGKHWGDDYSTSRQVDHRDIQEVLESENNGVDAMVNMIANGNIRLMPETGGINLAVMPNETQINRLKDYIRHFKGEVIVDIDAVGGDTIHSFTYNRGTNPAAVIRDIKAYFEDGTIPQAQPDYRQFLYSDRVTDKNTIDFLENQEHITTYKAMQLIDGKLYPPMAAKVRGDDGKYRLTNPSELGVWQQAVEDPSNIKFNDKGIGYYTLNKGNGKSISAAYNPYEHSSNLVLNDQFEEAYQRDNLVTVECVIPASEMSSGYQAQYAKDPTGMLDWKAGVVAGKLKDNPRKVYLSRWLKPVRILTDAETASKYREILGENVSVPFNVVSPSLLTELEKAGVSIDYKGSPLYKSLQKRKAASSSEKHQERSTDSNRFLLANALETTVQNDIEAKKLAEYKEKINLIDAEQQKLAEINAEIKELSFSKGKRDTEKLKSLRFDAVQAANRINTFDRQLLNLESTKVLKRVLEREKGLARKRQKQENVQTLKEYREKFEAEKQKIKERNAESRRKATEGRHRTVMRNKIRKVVSELNQLLLNGTKDNHVMIGLQKVVAEALDAVNMDTVGAEERTAKYDALIAKETGPDVIAALAEKRDRIQAMGDKMSDKLTALKNAYGEIKNSTDPLIANSYDEVITSRLEDVAEKVGNTSLRDMTLSQLEEVYDMYMMVLTTIRNANKTFKAERSESIAVLGNNTMMEVEKAGGSKTHVLGGKLGSAVTTVKSFDFNNLKPVYAFERIGSKTLSALYENVRKGEDTWAVDITEAKDFKEAVSKKYGTDKWDYKKVYTFKSSTGRAFTLTLEQMMSLYAYSKREQALPHLAKGGFVFDQAIETYKEKDGKKSILKYRVNTATAYKVSEAEVNTIIAELGKIPGAIKFVDEMQDYLSTVMGGKGNEISLAMYGIKLFKEKFYFPLKSAKQYMFEQNEVAGEVKIKNAGFSKATVKHANNPVILSNFMDVWANHVNDMSMYHAFVLPLEDFNRVFNYKTPASENLDEESVKQFIQNAYGTQANQYISQLLKDLNGGARVDPRESIARNLIGKFKKAAVFGSASVVIQQPSAVARALALIDAKYFDFNPKIISHNKLWAEVKKYAPVAIIKEMGHFDTDMGRSSVDYIRGDKTVMNAVDDFLSKPAAYMDELTWVHIWTAVKREVQAKNKDLHGEALLKKSGERFTEVITKTQVYDSVLSRSANMRSKGMFMNMVTSFMAEPTTSINMLENAITDWKRGNKSKASKAVASVAASVVLNSLLVSLIYAARDDDEDETYLEKYVGSLTAELIDGFNPITYYPFLKDVWSIMQGYDIERSDMSIISKAVDSLKDIVSVMAKDTDDMTEEELAEHKQNIKEAWLEVAGDLSSLVGIPAKNLIRDIKAGFNAHNTVKRGQQSSFSLIWDEVAETAKSSVPVVGWLPKESKQDKLYDAIVSGDKVQIDRLRIGYKNESAYINAVSKALRDNDPRIREAAEARINGNMTGYKRVALEIKGEGHFSQDIIVRAINSEMNSLEKGESTSSGITEKPMYTNADYFKAALSGNSADVNAVKEYLVESGKKESAIESTFNTSVKDAYENGEINSMRAIALMAEYGGKTSEEASLAIEYSDFKADYPEYADSISESKYAKYHEPIADYYGYSLEDVGIGTEDYAEYCEQSAKAEGVDANGDGKADTGSVKAEVMGIIDSLPLTYEQKDALYYFNGWSAKTIYEAPWH